MYCLIGLKKIILTNQFYTGCFRGNVPLYFVRTFLMLKNASTPKLNGYRDNVQRSFKD
jgi:hypothetical protein